MEKNSACGEFLFCITLLLMALLIFLIGNAGHIGAYERPDCGMDKGACTGRVGNIEILFDISPKPVTAMKELKVSVSMKDGHQFEEVSVDFKMPGMYMGRNRVVLKKDAEGRYTGKAVIPRCSSGRKLWKATVDIPKTGKAEFFFNVY